MGLLTTPATLRKSAKDINLSFGDYSKSYQLSRKLKQGYDHSLSETDGSQSDTSDED